MITFRLSKPTPSLNAASGASGNWRARHARKRKLQRGWAIEMMAQMRGKEWSQVGPKGILHAKVTIERHSAGVLDVDNLYGGVKALLDCLRPISSNPYGLGLIQDDKPITGKKPGIELIVRQVKSTRAGACTVVTIEPA